VDQKKKLFVSNLDFEVSEEQLKELFAGIASVTSVTLAVDRETRRSKGFAFVEMDSEESAKTAIKELNDKEVSGRPIRVTEDRGKGGGFASKGAEGEDRGPREHLPPIQRMQLFRKRTKVDPFLSDPDKVVDYRDVAMMSKFVSERGKILSRKMTGLTAQNQRKVAKAIKRAQNLGLMPFSS